MNLTVMNALFQERESHLAINETGPPNLHIIDVWFGEIKESLWET